MYLLSFYFEYCICQISTVILVGMVLEARRRVEQDNRRREFRVRVGAKTALAVYESPLQKVLEGKEEVLQ